MWCDEDHLEGELLLGGARNLLEDERRTVYSVSCSGRHAELSRELRPVSDDAPCTWSTLTGL